MNKKRFSEILASIRSVKIQGATNVALAGIKAFLISNKTKKEINQIVTTRPTEPLLQSSLKILTKSKNPNEDTKEIINYVKNSEKKIAELGSKLIKKDMNIFSHCHSTTVLGIIKKAKKQKKNFVVYTLEVEPLMQGRKTAEELAKEGIKVIVLPDLAVESVIKKCDLVLFGADAYLKKGVVNKIGTGIIAEISKKHNIPNYSCGISLKYTKKIKIENREGKEVWNKRNENISIENPAFDFADGKNLTGVISELGIFSYKEFIKRAKKNIKLLEKTF